MDEQFEIEIEFDKQGLIEAIKSATGTVALGDNIDIDDDILQAIEESPAKDKRVRSSFKSNFPKVEEKNRGITYYREGQSGTFTAIINAEKSDITGVVSNVANGSSTFKIGDTIVDKNGKFEIPNVKRILKITSEGEGAGNITLKVEKKDEEPIAGIYKVSLQTVTNKIESIKVIRDSLGLGLKESKELVESVPTIVAEGLTEEKAKELVSLLEGSGATAVIEK